MAAVGAQAGRDGDERTAPLGMAHGEGRADHAAQAGAHEGDRRRAPDAVQPRRHEIGQAQVVPDLHLSAGFPKHPGADSHHQARLFGNADEAARRHEPELRMSPA